MQHKWHREAKEEIIGWSLEARGDALKRKGGESMDDRTLRGGQNKGSASAGERILMEGMQWKTEANNRKTRKRLKLIRRSCEGLECSYLWSD